MQIERDAEIRAVMPTPQEGDLPLPEGLPQGMLECNPQAVEDLNAVVPEGSQQLFSQQLNEHVSPSLGYRLGVVCVDTHSSCPAAGLCRAAADVLQQSLDLNMHRCDSSLVLSLGTTVYVSQLLKLSAQIH